jgi:peptidyl-tRNA hydrolase, PTH1 family
VKIIVGLGNPGKEYQISRHNIGFIAVDDFAEERGIKFSQDKKFASEIAKASIYNVSCLLLKPQSYINLSGSAVRKVIDYYKVSISDIVVIHDDIDLELGSVRYRLEGGHGGHNGLKSLISCLGSCAFARIKVGIGKPEIKSGENKQQIVSNWVLGPLSKNECKQLTDISLPLVYEYVKKFIE